ncbi:MAG: hypothetical protein KDK33_12240, partial [Leptospiraceae bacterium]|nr:hypothetical protein [Leptospiraceae bacterium]
MNKLVRLLVSSLITAIVSTWALSCAVTSNESVAVSQGEPTAWSDLVQSLSAKKGPITITQVRAADWAVSRAGL